MTEQLRAGLDWWATSSDTAAQIAAAFQTRVIADGGIVESLSAVQDRVQALKTLGIYNDASLIFIPSAYKEDKLYNVKGSVDWTYVRAGTKTRLGQNMLEAVPYNLFSQSKSLATAPWTWTGTAGTVTNNAGIAPDGSITATRILFASGSQSSRRQPSILGGQITSSFWVKSNTGSNQAFRLIGNSAGGPDLIATTTWQKFTYTYTASVGPTHGIGNDSTFTAGDILVWQAQAVVGSVVRDEISTTDRFDVPALDYSTGINPALNLEPARTNLLLRSEEFDNASWTKNASTVSANAIVGVDNLSTVDLLLETNTNNNHSFIQGVAKAASSITYTLSVYAKGGAGRDYCGLQLYNVSDGIRAWFNLTTGVKGTSASIGVGWTLVDYSMEPAPNGFYRCKLTVTSDTALNVGTLLFTAPSDGVITHLGDITKGIYWEKVQLEAGLYASSYVPTTTATVTRIVDAVTDISGISSLIGVTGSTIYIHMAVYNDPTANYTFSIHDGTSTNRLNLLFSLVGGNFRVIASSGGALQADFNAGVLVAGAFNKAAVTMQANKIALFVDGVKLSEDLAVTLPVGLDRIALQNSGGSGDIYGMIKGAELYNRALTDLEAIALTTP